MFCLLICLLVCCVCVHCAIFLLWAHFFSWELLDNPIACKNNLQTYHLLQQQTWSPPLPPSVPLPCNDCCIVMLSLLPLEISSDVELLFSVLPTVKASNHPLHQKRNNIVPISSSWTTPPMLYLRNSLEGMTCQVSLMFTTVPICFVDTFHFSPVTFISFVLNCRGRHLHHYQTTHWNCIGIDPRRA